MKAKRIDPTEFHCEFHDGKQIFAHRILNFIPRVGDKLSMEDDLYEVISVTYSLDEIVRNAIAVFVIVDRIED